MGKLETVSRRSFLISTAVVGGGFAIGFQLSPSRADDMSDKDAPWPKDTRAPEVSPWLVIAPDNTITVRTPSTEIGNGVATQLAMTIAEELNVDWSKMKIEFASMMRNAAENGVYDAPFETKMMATFAGRSTTEEHLKLGLQVGASARERLKAAAAAQWKVPVTEIATANSVLTHTPTGRTLKYGDVAAKAGAIKLAQEPAPKPRSEWKILGKAMPGKLNNPSIVDGTAVYGMDVRVPGMVYAALRQSPAHGGKIKKFDASVAKKMPGVLAVVTVDPSESLSAPDQKQAPFMGAAASAVQPAIAVIAEHYWQARKALDAVQVEWDAGPGGKWKTTEVMNKAAYDLLDQKGLTEMMPGDVSAIDQQEKIIEGSYLTPYCDHATMEPLNGTALVTADRVEIWQPTQIADMSYRTAADEAGLKLDKVVLHQTYVGGGFGRRDFGDDTRMVVAVARKFPGRPVHVIWSREESIRQGRYRTLAAAKLRAGLDKKTGLPVALHARIAGAEFGSGGLSDTPYAFKAKNLKIESAKLPFNLLTGPYRGPGHNSFAFVSETFIDECAHAAGIDPVQYRLKLLEGHPDKGWVACLKEASTKAGWGKSLPRGTGMGVAIANWGNGGKVPGGTTVCAVATVEVSKAGKLKVHQIDVAFDCGGILNRDAVVTQLVGGTLFGLNMSLNEGLNINNGHIVEGNYDEYPMVRMADTPKINIHFGGLSGHERFSEIGEPPVGVVGPAVGNAIFAATGKRLRSTPFRLEDISWT